MLLALLALSTIALMGGYYMNRLAANPFIPRGRVFDARYAPFWDVGNGIVAIGTAIALIWLYGVWWWIGSGVFAAVTTVAVRELLGWRGMAVTYLLGIPVTFLALLLAIVN